MSERPTKQVIVMRTDLNMRKGKMVAQGAHASLAAVLEIQKYLIHGDDTTMPHWLRPFQEWLTNSYAKICVGVSSEIELWHIYNTAFDANLPVKLITDN